MALIAQGDLASLLAIHAPPCLSVYLPTHRHYPDNQQDPIRFKNLLKSLESSLLQRYPASEAKPHLERFQTLLADSDFWNHTWDGLAVFGTAELFRVIKLQRAVPELAIAAESFHVKPLLRMLQSADRYQVLCVNRREIHLFEGSRDALDEVDLATGVPRTLTEALGDELTEPHQTVASYGGTGLGSSMRHGHGGKKDEVDSDSERFFRAVDRSILEHHSRPSGLPLILAALAQYHAPFRAVSHNPFLIDGGIHVDPSAVTSEDLRHRAWGVVEPEIRARLKSRTDEFAASQSKGLASDDLAKVAQAAFESRVETLLVESERQIPGHLDKSSGALAQGGLDEPQIDDLLDDLAVFVLSRGGHVFVVPAAQMPTATGVAAIFRF